MNLYDATIPVFTKFLGNLERWLDKAVKHAEHRKFDPEVFVQQRLAPDMFPLSGQIQAACDTMKYAAARMTGKEPPSHPDTEKTLADLRARIATCRAYLETFKPEDFAGSEERLVKHTWMPGPLRGGDYLDHYVLPNVHFHLTSAYAILRHNGVELGKGDFLGSLPFRT
jgi:hypothetical protein